MSSTLNRRTFLEQSSRVALGAAALAMAPPSGNAVAQPITDANSKAEPSPLPTHKANAMRPNILYIIAHDLGRSLACLGTPDVLTPRLDQFAAEGMRFTNHYCNSAACSPARGCIMTGRYAHSNGLIGLAHLGLHLPQSEETIVDYMNDAGYETWQIGAHHERRREDNRYQHLVTPESTYIEDQANEVIEFLHNRKSGDTPFYLNVGSFDVHRPWNQRIVHDGSPAGYHTTEGRPECQPFQDRYQADKLTLPVFLPEMQFYREEMRQFYGVISHMDEQVGRIFDALKASGLEENTLVIFTTDHGIDFPRAKSTLYDPGMTTAMLMRWPGRIEAGMECSELTQHIDLTPTLLEIAGAPIPERVQGRSYAPLLLGADYQPNDCVFFERNFHGDFDPMRAVRTQRHKLIRNYSDRFRYGYPWESKEGDDPAAIHKGPEKRAYEELYDLQQDPGEVHNLADKPELAGVLKDLRERLDRWQDETADFMRGGYAANHFPAIDTRC